MKINVTGKSVLLATGETATIVGVRADALLVRVAGLTRGTPRKISLAQVRARLNEDGSWTLKEYLRVSKHALPFEAVA